jgi:hypothetical protein
LFQPVSPLDLESRPHVRVRSKMLWWGWIGALEVTIIRLERPMVVRGAGAVEIGPHIQGPWLDRESRPGDLLAAEPVRRMLRVVVDGRNGTGKRFRP